VALSRPGAIWGHGPSARELVEGLAEIGALEDSVLRDEAAQVYVEGEILRLAGLSSLSDRMNATPPGPEGAIHKMLAAPHGQTRRRSGQARPGRAGLDRRRERRSPPQLADGDDPYADLGSCLLVQPGGDAGRRHTGDLKNVVAERMLGLPREADPDGQVPLVGEEAMNFALSEDHLVLRQTCAHLPREGDLAPSRAGARRTRWRCELRRQLGENRRHGLAGL
jgi:hypothetical protein